MRYTSNTNWRNHSGFDKGRLSADGLNLGGTATVLLGNGIGYQ